MAEKLKTKIKIKTKKDGEAGFTIEFSHDVGIINMIAVAEAMQAVAISMVNKHPTMEVDGLIDSVTRDIKRNIKRQLEKGEVQ